MNGYKAHNKTLVHLYTLRSVKLPVKHTLTLPPSYLKIHSFIVILLYPPLIVFIALILWICTV